MTPALGAHHVRIERVVEWPDTDAAGHYHHATVARWVEAAEAELHEQLIYLELWSIRQLLISVAEHSDLFDRQ